MTNKGIETIIEGQTFRSRLEARWAVFFTALGWNWTYEPFDGDFYIPDFLIHGNKPLIVEVKPYSTYDECSTELQRILGVMPDWNGEALVVGCDPQLNDCAGAIGDHRDGRDEAIWHVCRECSLFGGALGIHGKHDSVRRHRDLDGFADLSMHPCRHAIGGWSGTHRSERISKLWREAGDRVRYEHGR